MRNAQALECLSLEWFTKLAHLPMISPIMLMRKSGLNFERCEKIIDRIREMRTK
jgi:hypothetical protein